jgi:hypothetical protein
MRERLRALFCAYSTRTYRTPSQSAILREAGCVVLSPYVSDQVIRATIEELEAAFKIRNPRPENTPAAINSGIILEFPRA